MRALTVLLIVAATVFSGCETGKVCDLRREAGEVCEIHHLYMHAEKYPNPHRTFPPSQEYLAARTHLFVHAKPTLYLLPDECKYAMVYVCDECVRAERDWRAAHPGAAP